MDAVAPALLVAQGIGRVGNYFNKELFGGPTTLPWGLEIPYQYRVSGGIPAKDLGFSTFQPTFLYELIWDFALAALLIWLGHHRRVKAPGLFALYVAGYSAFRIFEEALRVDSSEHFLGLRLNTYVASALLLIGLIWFWRTQRRPGPVEAPDKPSAGESAAPDQAAPDQAAPDQAAPDQAAPAASAAAAGEAASETQQAAEHGSA
jgi:prolipoprotein diacylglyceryltransferase